jgi:MoxR-like ATPase
VTDVLTGTVADTARLAERILAEVDQVIVGKRDTVAMVLLGVLASGHILIEDLPGLGKTLLACSSPGSSSPRTCCPPT